MGIQSESGLINAKTIVAAVSMGCIPPIVFYFAMWISLAIGQIYEGIMAVFMVVAWVYMFYGYILLLPFALIPAISSVLVENQIGSMISTPTMIGNIVIAVNGSVVFMLCLLTYKCAKRYICSHFTSNRDSAQQVDSAEASTIGVRPSNLPGSPR